MPSPFPKKVLLSHRMWWQHWSKYHQPGPSKATFLGGEVGCNHLARPPTNHQGQLNRKFVHSLCSFIFLSHTHSSYLSVIPLSTHKNCQHTIHVWTGSDLWEEFKTKPDPSNALSSNILWKILKDCCHSAALPHALITAPAVIWSGATCKERLESWNESCSGMGFCELAEYSVFTAYDSNSMNLSKDCFARVLSGCSGISDFQLRCPSMPWPSASVETSFPAQIATVSFFHMHWSPGNSITKALGPNKHVERKQQILWDIDGHRPLPGFLLSSRIEAHHIWPQEDLGFRQRLGRFQCFKGSRRQTGDILLHEFICTARANTSTFISRYYGWSTAVMLENTQNISLEGRDATIPQFYNHPRLPKDRVTCCIISKRQRARCHSLDFSQALMVALKLMISGCTSADFMYSKASRDLPSFQVSTRSGMFFVWLTRKRMRYGIWYLCQITSIYED